MVPWPILAYIGFRLLPVKYEEMQNGQEQHLMSRSPVNFSIHYIHGHVEGHKFVNSFALLVLVFLPHFIV